MSTTSLRAQEFATLSSNPGYYVGYVTDADIENFAVTKTLPINFLDPYFADTNTNAKLKDVINQKKLVVINYSFETNFMGDVYLHNAVLSKLPETFNVSFVFINDENKLISGETIQHKKPEVIPDGIYNTACKTAAIMLLNLEYGNIQFTPPCTPAEQNHREFIVPGAHFLRPKLLAVPATPTNTTVTGDTATPIPQNVKVAYQSPSDSTAKPIVSATPHRPATPKGLLSRLLGR